MLSNAPLGGHIPAADLGSDPRIGPKLFAWDADQPNWGSPRGMVQVTGHKRQVASDRRQAASANPEMVTHRCTNRAFAHSRCNTNAAAIADKFVELASSTLAATTQAATAAATATA